MIKWNSFFNMKMPKPRVVLWTAFAAALVFFLFQMNILSVPSARLSAQRGFDLLETLLAHIRHDYIEERDPLRTAEGAYRGLLNSLDPLSCYLDKDLTAQYLARDTERKETGIVILKEYNAFPSVVGVVPGSPAEGAGLKFGDVVSAINDEDTLYMSLIEINLRLKTPSEAPLALKVLRGNETLRLNVDKEILYRRPFAFVQEPGRPSILKIRAFEPSLMAMIKEDVLPAIEDKRGALILDLRNCHEGDMEEARAFINLFLRSPRIGHFEKKGGVKRPLACANRALLPNLSLAVWTNAGTIGPAELVAGVLQELRRTPVIGIVTPGLVGMQEHHILKDESSILLTSEIFVLPSGQKLWDRGVSPDGQLLYSSLNDKGYLEKTLPLLPRR